MSSLTRSAACIALVLCGAAHAAPTAHWSYEGAEGPAHWGELDPDYAACKTGHQQSPIDIRHTQKAALPAIAFDYHAKVTDIVDNGHTVQVNVAPGSTMTVDGHTYTLKQFHFHTPSENTIQGHHYAMEAHFVNADADGHLAVVAVMFDRGAANPTLAQIWKEMPTTVGDDRTTDTAIDYAALLPAKHDYYRFDGSLTTPPCSEGVSWMVMKADDSVSAAQLEQFATLVHHHNNRPVQPLHARRVDG